MTAAVLLLAAALLVWPPAPGPLARLVAQRRVAQPPEPAGAGRRWGLAALAGAAVLAVGGLGPGTALLAVGIAVAVERWARRSAATGPDEGARVRSDLPLVCDLLAVCLAAGTPVGAGVGAVGAAVGGPLGDALVAVARQLQLGAAPRTAWHRAPTDAAALARVVVRAGESGSSVVPALHALAGDLRAAQRTATAAAVQRAGVWVLAPLGLCFLPAFLCLGVVPLVLGIAADVLG
ncbi:Type II secretion system (T2SS), protein F [Klenkia marina]|uniref:Type II secretion system (T2SS), protein F n=1 Tax=Klenkia marina TaxID=1960309 RepID=A0A1G4XE47_9ACTN|nr:type II secretion system F family protein [Klenkia marina]SCX39469.1 Type II secretion system (T2SS), protein F [Klenkia marina]